MSSNDQNKTQKAFVAMSEAIQATLKGTIGRYVPEKSTGGWESFHFGSNQSRACLRKSATEAGLKLDVTLSKEALVKAGVPAERLKDGAGGKRLTLVDGFTMADWKKILPLMSAGHQTGASSAPVELPEHAPEESEEEFAAYEE